MKKVRPFISALNLSPLAIRGILLLGVILTFLILDRVWTYNLALQERQRTLHTQLAQLEAIEAADDPQLFLDAALGRAGDYEATFLSEETIGLNTAKFQVELASIFEACGAEQTVIDIITSEAEGVANIAVLEANVRMRGTLLITSRCLHGLNLSSVRMDVASIRWNSPQQLLLQVRAYALNSVSEVGS